MERQIDMKKLKDCAHCPVNPKATKTFLKMTRVSVGAQCVQGLQETAKHRNEQPECYVCGLVEDMLNGLEQAFKD